MRVLVAEDDAALRSVIERGLRESGYVVDAVADGQSALNYLRIYDYELAVIDWRMPVRSGLDVVRDLRRRGSPLPVLMLTARDSTGDRVIGLDEGADDYGKLIVYEFPKEKLVYGPFQIEARINQNTEISQQISLWNQMGSRVIRGNLLVVPIANSILYVSPLYLRAESGQLPELKRVIAAYGGRVVMKETLPEALAELFKASVPVAPSSALAEASSSGPPDERARKALGHYDRAIDRLKAGDWAGFGSELDALRQLLEELGRPPVTH